MADTFQLAVDDRSAFDKAAALTLGTDQLSQGNGSRPHLKRTKHHRLPSSGSTDDSVVDESTTFAQTTRGSTMRSKEPGGCPDACCGGMRRLAADSHTPLLPGSSLRASTTLDCCLPRERHFWPSCGAAWFGISEGTL